MLRLVVHRALVAIPTLIIVSMMIFGLQKMLPGDPVLAMAGEDQNPQVIAALREKYHLDKPLPTQYALWMRDVMRGDLGTSLRTGEPVTTLIAQKLPVTLQLALFGLVIAIGIGIPLGILSAANRGSAIDYGANVLALSGMSIPNFWLGILLIFLVSVRWQLLPSSGYVPPGEDLWMSLKTMVMPAFVLGAALGAQLMRHTRSAMLGVLRTDYIRTARAKGLLRGTVVLKHALRNALIPIVTVLALLFGELLAGAVLTEQVFTIPGFGKLVVDAVFNRDYAVVQGVVLVTAVSFIVLNLLADVLYVLLNPRLRRA
ncbi:MULTISPECIES: ABC transporter permease [Pandoraea]|jgi:peptide/nickel transport system permease protein|uniref:Dipeptide transport system permease protein dppB n=1 Tax=Pandoraea pnomenusa TaxID=93220 RepID=A0A378YWF0_9BURK|nr:MULTISPECIES: ABC transporter permease [Pandoraea]AHB07150.1 peptide ABC transporter [Pandoraea pnomenusa 3kgm]AHB76674.1 peptide ABC transporter [Pandoraea pnomenusa]AHN74969.1 peptide ABC transporter [Pandoraea pnomenusa]AIU28512.1 peptide ABC transporter [Pandoraea pnomenusa]MBN9092148.1 ABC transporter permease [Pandoraea pnomenusa]